MTPRATRAHRRRGVVATLLALGIGLAGSTWVVAQGGTASAPATGNGNAKSPVEQGIRWRELKPAQQALLKPLEREWSAIGTLNKQKWIEMAARFPTMPAAEQARIQERMAEWARLTPQQRSEARLNFQEAKQLPATDRKARWDEYQALPPEKKQQLAARAAPPAASAPSKAAPRDSQAKSNIVPSPALTARPKVISPVVVQASPGATTSPITRRPTPPLHQQTGLPKIAATPGFVDKATLLPQRGPQGAAVRGPAASAPGPAASR